MKDHTAGGYFLVRSTAGSPPWMPAEFDVKRTLSASSELVPIFPTPTWASDFEVLAARFRLLPEERPAAGEVADKLFDEGRLGWPDVFYELEDALGFYGRFAAARDDVLVIGAGLAEHFVDPVLAELGSSGVPTRLRRREPLAPGGTALGYEILGMDVPPFESWVVNHLPALAHERLGVDVNDDGLVASFDEAVGVAEFVSRSDVPSEPFNWRPWLLVQYPVYL